MVESKKGYRENVKRIDYTPKVQNSKRIPKDYQRNVQQKKARNTKENTVEIQKTYNVIKI